MRRKQPRPTAWRHRRLKARYRGMWYGRKNAAVQNGLKWCNGPLHDGPERLPLREFYRLKNSKYGKTLLYSNICKNCQMFKNKWKRTTVPTYQYKWVFDRLVLKHGSITGASRASGLSKSTISNIRHEHRNTTKKETIEKALKCLLSN